MIETRYKNLKIKMLDNYKQIDKLIIINQWAIKIDTKGNNIKIEMLYNSKQ